MKSIKVVITTSSGALIHSPTLAVFPITQTDLDRIGQIRELISSYDLSEARYAKPEVAYHGGDFTLGVPEIVVTGHQLYVSALFHEYETETPCNTVSFDFKDLVEAFEQSADGDIWFAGQSEEDLLEQVCENAEDFDLDKHPIGYQVANTATGEHWDDRPSYEVIPYALASEEFEKAKGFGDKWELWTIYPDTIEEPTLALV